MRRFTVAAVLLLLLASCNTVRNTVPGGSGGSGGPPSTTAASPLQVDMVASGLRNPWDIGFLPDGRALVTQRTGRISLLSGPLHGRRGATVTQVDADLSDVYARGEGGLLGLLIHPDFADSHRFTTCYAHQDPDGNPVDIRLVTWQLSADAHHATRVVNPLLAGLPLNPSGRHSGCRMLIDPDGALLVGTGDTARGRFAQDRTNLGGKVLRVDPATGAPWPGNPFASSPNATERLVYSFGHRNVQGLATQPGSNKVFILEQGSTRDDEVNISMAGANYGWDPSRGGTEDSYDESVPMTDLQRFPDAVSAVWSSGDPTEAASGGTFLSGRQWGELAGALAVAALKGSKLILLTLSRQATVQRVAVPVELDDTYGRLRTAVQGPDGALYVTTDNGDNDEVLRISK